jgi:hypothetical protein
MDDGDAKRMNGSADRILIDEATQDRQKGPETKSELEEVVAGQTGQYR